jgi:hypothetical protein
MTVRLGKLIRLLSSDRPGEMVAAAGAITRALQAAGSDIHALADIVERASLVPQQTPSTPDDDERPWREIRRWCADHGESLSEREREFIDSLAYWRGQPTPKQMNWLAVIEKNIRRRQAR